MQTFDARLELFVVGLGLRLNRGPRVFRGIAGVRLQSRGKSDSAGVDADQVSQQSAQFLTFVLAQRSLLLLLVFSSGIRPRWSHAFNGAQRLVDEDAVGE